jgi:hypothetical protein
MATQVASVPTPRESTPAEPAPRPNTHKLLHAVGKKLATAPVSSSAPPPATKRKRAASPPTVSATTYKRRKTFGSTSHPGHTRELIRKGWSRAGRKHHANVKAREVRPLHLQKRPRGRPRLHPLPSSARPSSSASAPLSTATVSAPPALDFSHSNLSLSPDSRTAKSRAVDDQPREINGRFGKKATTNGKFRRRLVPPPVLRRTRAQRAEGRAEAQREAEASASAPTTAENGTSTAVKRERDYEYDAVEADGVETSAKRSRVLSSGAPTQYFSPNPMSFARKKWAPALPPPPPSHHLRSLGTLPRPDSDSASPRAAASTSHLSPLPLPRFLAEGEDLGNESDGIGSSDGSLPVTPENLPGHEPEAEQGGDAGAESEDNEPLRSNAAVHPVPTLWKPSPFAFAARRWASQENNAVRQERENDRMRFFRTYQSEQQFSFRGPKSAISRNTGTGTGASAGIGNTSAGAGTGARSSSAGGSISRTEWIQVNGTAEQFRRWDPYGVDTASVSEEEVC